MPFFDEAAKIDLLHPVERDIAEGRLTLREDGTIHLGTKVMANMAWLYAKRTDRKCGKWMDIYWKVYGFQAKACATQCLKVCMKINTLAELMQVMRLQEKMGLPSKCGSDHRGYTDCLYSAFWYCPLGCGMVEAVKLWKEVKDAVHKEVSPKIEVILKRGCTEMELQLGPSNKWQYSAADEEFEDLLDGVWKGPEKQPEQSANLKVHIQRRWVEWAAAHGDRTYILFTGRPWGLIPYKYNPIEGKVIEDAGDDKPKCEGCAGSCEKCDGTKGESAGGGSGKKGQLALV